MSEEHDWVRRLLADEGQAPEPMPPDVAARLDRVLDEQAVAAGTTEPGSEADGSGGDQRVLPMTGRRQRRWAGALLAAAALTVGGYSLTATGSFEGLAGGAASDSTSAESAGGSTLDSRDGATGDRPESEVAPGSGAETGADLRATGAAAISSDTLRRDAARLVSADAERPYPADGEGSRGSRTPERSSSATSSPQQPAGCVPPPAGVPGARVPVSLDGRPATALLRRTGDDRTVVTVWDCVSPSRLARIVVAR